MKRLVIGSVVAGFALATMAAFAEEAAAPAAAAAPAVEKHAKAVKAPAAMEEMTVVGTITKTETTKKDRKTGEERKVAQFVVTDAAGTQIMLSTGHGKKGATAVNLEALVGKTVKIVGKGDKKRIMVESATEEAAAAPAAEAPKK